MAFTRLSSMERPKVVLPWKVPHAAEYLCVSGGEVVGGTVGGRGRDSSGTGGGFGGDVGDEMLLKWGCALSPARGSIVRREK